MDHIIDNCKGINAGTTAHSRETVHNIRRRMNLLLRTGQILVDSSADTSRIVRNMHRAAAFLGFKTEYIHIYVDYYMLTVSFSVEGFPRDDRRTRTIPLCVPPMFSGALCGPLSASAGRSAQCEISMPITIKKVIPRLYIRVSSVCAI